MSNDVVRSGWFNFYAFGSSGMMPDGSYETKEEAEANIWQGPQHLGTKKITIANGKIESIE